MKNIKVIWKIYETDLLGNRLLVKHYKVFDNIRDAIKYVAKLKYDICAEYIEIIFH